MKTYPKYVQCMHCSTHVYNLTREIKPGDPMLASDVESANPEEYTSPEPYFVLRCPKCGHMWSGVAVIGEATVFK